MSFIRYLFCLMILLPGGLQAKYTLGGGSRLAQPVKVYHTPDRLELVPNPAKQTVSIIIPPDEKIEQVLIFDNTGRMSAQQSRENLLDVSLLQNGIYQIHVKTEVKTRQGKLIILK